MRESGHYDLLFVGLAPDGRQVRISVKGGGCSGFSYGFDLDKSRAEDDFAFLQPEHAVGVVVVRRPAPAADVDFGTTNDLAIDDDAKSETKSPGSYGGEQSSIGMARSHAARQSLELSGRPR